MLSNSLNPAPNSLFSKHQDLTSDAHKTTAKVKII